MCTARNFPRDTPTTHLGTHLCIQKHSTHKHMHDHTRTCTIALTHSLTKTHTRSLPHTRTLLLTNTYKHTRVLNKRWCSTQILISTHASILIWVDVTLMLSHKYIGETTRTNFDFCHFRNFKFRLVVDSVVVVLLVMMSAVVWSKR